MGNNMLVNEITRLLTSRGISVHVQPSVTTSSFYLIFDNGVLKSARVGDHKGKPKYNYTYEIGPHIKAYAEIPAEWNGRQFTRHRYPPEQLNDLVMSVLVQPANTKAKYGEANYASFVAQRA